MGRTKSIPSKLNLPTNVLIQDYNVRNSTKRRSSVTCSYSIFPPTDFSEQYYLGYICLGNSNNILPVEWRTCKVSFIYQEQTSIKLEFDLDLTAIINVTNDDTFVKGLFTSKVFAMKFHNVEDIINVDLYIAQFPLTKFNKTVGTTIKTVFASIFNVQHENMDNISINKISETTEIMELYKNVKIEREKTVKIPNVSVQHPLLKPKLRPYQEDAVKWMIFKEQDLTNSEIMHPLYEEFLLSTQKPIYFNKYTGYIDNVKPIAHNFIMGGILADEMGLGKTVEVLACILSHPKANNILDYTVNGETPTVQQQHRKRIRIINTNEDNYVCKPKKLKIPDDWVKMKKQSSTRIALNMWYDNTLKQLSVTSSPKIQKNNVQCICGETHMDNAVQCIDCLKYQHADCLGYKTKYGNYRCPKCWLNQPLLETKATLIVFPMSLRSQWCEEICKHVNANFKVLMYEGSKAIPVYPIKFQKYDLVLTCYSTLQNDFRYLDIEQGFKLRRESRYSAPGSPISLIKWWRLCLDEAQTVEGNHSTVSTMAKRLHAYHRWAITGTPISRSISSLYGLIDYLQLQPYDEEDTWKYLLYSPYLYGNVKPLHQFLANVMWRTSKNDVIDQINIPMQTIKQYVIEFSAVEKYYYKREHQLCKTFFLSKLEGYDMNVLFRTLNRKCFKKILSPLFSIRQACNYPNTTRGRYLATRKSVTSMEGLLDALIEKNMADSEENLRIIVSALNGLAGIHLLLGNPVLAVEKYRKVLQLSARFNNEDSKKGLSVDKLQLIHTLHNLAEIMETQPSVQPTLRDHTLRQDCVNLQEKYMEKYIKQNLNTYEETEVSINNVKNLQKKLLLMPGQWYSALIEWITINGLSEDLNTRILTALENAGVQKLNILHEREFLYIVSIWDENLQSLRNTTINILKKMYTYNCRDNHKLINIEEELVQKAMNCHLRPTKKQKIKTCLVCNVSVQMRKYEAVLFDMSKKSEEDISNKGSWKPTYQELLLKGLYNLGKHKNADEVYIKDGELYFTILEAMKKEFKQMRKFWTYLDQQICAHDEINMCKLRLSLKQPNTEHKNSSKTDHILKQLSTVLENKLEFINLIEEHELNFHMSILESEEKQNLVILERNLGTHSYLETLRRQQYAGQNPDPCPICKNPLQDHWSILPCGHCYCLECIQSLLEKTNANRIACCVCRQLQKIEDVSYIRMQAETNNQEKIKLKGNYSTKIEAVIKLILKLRNEEVDVKILVFSSWHTTLKILQTALKNNDISTELMLPTNIEQNLNKLKSNSITALLLPIRLGSKGLNLIEATHVILMEPLLNLDDELQAIGRVHRIGQTKPTTVHKFIVKNTIEETLHHATSTNADMWVNNKITLKQLSDLFIDPFEENSMNENSNVLNDVLEI